MNTSIEERFLAQLNQHLAIAHKISRVYQSDADERADLVQEMIYQLWKAYPSFNGQAKFSTWMYSVCLNTALTYQRKAKRWQHQTLMPLHEQVPDAAPNDREDISLRLFEAIADLAPLNKAVIILHLDGLSYEEIATVLGISLSNVSVRLVRIRKELETRLKDKLKTQ
ncbi:RNA polymerase sigma-70 factor (ECF subfamily) [Larkinella arboricola]|uniref:RNA polymerase sigma-70 factor (ECF subfamily) n=1 Tax=Larkinella arboricola TaxID=643671 RepID=A0A327WLJ5_LARAB|nr:RNA polymerase sigma factor [Larkinella arboricola]RAJ90865.1 RNA polymerase sigma-70 factor (ECF subfamily) [Larkinella arboricola]